VPWRGPEEPGEFPTLGYLVGDWIEAHCVVGDGDMRGHPYRLTDEMWRFLLWHYRLREGASEQQPASAWAFRRSQLVRPQKWGKGPFSAAIICAEAVGPTVFAGWDSAGEPVGREWPTPLIQITAASEDQTDNVYRQLVPMIDLGPLADLIPDTGETRINLPGGGRIDPVTSKARSRLGQPVTFVVQDETGTWTRQNGGQALADTQRRGLAGMGGRAIETTNAWDPAENSVAQQTAEASAKDIHRDHVQPPKPLSYKDRRDRRKIHRLVYGDSIKGIPADPARKIERVPAWVDIDRIEAEAAELLERDPQQAERFFGNRLVVTGGSWLKDGLWAAACAPQDVPEGEEVTLGFDGSDSDDWTAIRACTLDGYRFTPTYGPDDRPTIWNPAEWGDQIPRTEVHAAVDEICGRYRSSAPTATRPTGSPRSATGRCHGEDVFVEWATYRIVQMHAALERLVIDLTPAVHARRLRDHEDARRQRAQARPARQRYILGKPAQHQKIDAAMADVLANEAAADAREAGSAKTSTRRVVVFR
jgi:hypothetical protein